MSAFPISETIPRSRNSGLILVDGAGQVVAANSAARRHLATTEGVGLHGNEWRGLRSECGAPLERALRRVLDPAESPEVREMARLRRTGARAPLLAVVARWEADIPAAGPSAFVSLTDPEEEPELDPAPLAVLFGLTRTESRIACRLAAGLTLEEAARAFGMTINTARTHLKRVLQKTEAHRQSELVALVLRAARI